MDESRVVRTLADMVAAVQHLVDAGMPLDTPVNFHLEDDDPNAEFWVAIYPEGADNPMMIAEPITFGVQWDAHPWGGDEAPCCYGNVTSSGQFHEPGCASVDQGKRV